MKSITLFRRYLIYLLIPFSFVACSEDPEPGTVAEGKIAATIDGVYYEADAEATLYGNGEFRLNSKSGNARLSVSMSHAPVVGTYELKGAAIGPPAQEWINYIPNGSLIFSSSSGDPGLVVGTLTISEIDETNKTISGTFSSKIFHGDLVSEVTSGEFNKAPYEIIPPNTMTVKIDGVDFTAPTVVASSGLGSINVLGKTPSESQTIQIAFNSDIAVGTHPMGEFGDDIHAIYTVDHVSFVSSSSGTLTITKHDTSAKSVEGTFSFVGESVAEDGSTHTLTAGTFFILYH